MMYRYMMIWTPFSNTLGDDIKGTGNSHRFEGGDYCVVNQYSKSLICRADQTKEREQVALLSFFKLCYLYSSISIF